MHSGFDERDPNHFEIDKMKYGGKRGDLDKSVIHFNRFLTIRGIPMEVHNYRLGAWSALDWLGNRYQVKTDKRSQIQRNPNRWNADSGFDAAGKYIFDLLPPHRQPLNPNQCHRKITNKELRMENEFVIENSPFVIEKKKPSH